MFVIAEIIVRQFFFSSRRRHTRYIGDWSSDVCSSDLTVVPRPLEVMAVVTCAWPTTGCTTTPISSNVPPTRRGPTRRAGAMSVLLPPSGPQPRGGEARSEERRVGKEGRGGRWQRQQED